MTKLEAIEEEHRILSGEKLFCRYGIKGHDCRDEASLDSIEITSFGTSVIANRVVVDYIYTCINIIYL
ncbi:MAG: hypothetical protein APF77_00235 [Clostridia bacterium BRH_c25]|nr:MAG: hypothetical protein APF77_00235 [Clostridia bacterium BRH_c25]